FLPSRFICRLVGYASLPDIMPYFIAFIDSPASLLSPGKPLGSARVLPRRGAPHRRRWVGALRKHYIALVQADPSTYGVSSPDFPDVVTAARTIDAAVEKGRRDARPPRRGACSKMASSSHRPAASKTCT